jgi:hypothetical protein
MHGDETKSPTGKEGLSLSDLNLPIFGIATLAIGKYTIGGTLTQGCVFEGPPQILTSFVPIHKDDGAITDFIWSYSSRY